MNANVTHEDRLVAAVSHASILIPFFGATVPLIIFLARRKESNFVRLHSLQGFVVNLVSLLLITFTYIFYSVFLFIIMIPTMLLPFLVSSAPSGEANTVAAILIIIIMLLFIVALGIMTFVFYFLLPVMALVAVIAAGVTLGGRSFRYPILANRIDPNKAG